MRGVRGMKGMVAAALMSAWPLLAGGIDRNSAFAERILACHNRERAALNIHSLFWDEGLARDAQAWADHLARTGRLEHSPETPAGMSGAGENLWAGTAGAYSPEEMVGHWVEEKRDYTPGVFPAVSRSGDFSAVGHYTQLIWRRTARVGCGLGHGADEDVLVCRYQAAGNVVGERPI
jgi:hypothetical protein